MYQRFGHIAHIVSTWKQAFQQPAFGNCLKDSLQKPGRAIEPYYYGRALVSEMQGRAYYACIWQYPYYVCKHAKYWLKGEYSAPTIWHDFRSIQDCKARGVIRIAPMCALTLVARSFQIWPGKCSWHLQTIDQPEVGTRPCWGETLPDGAQWNDFVDVAKLHGKIQRKLCKGKGKSFWWRDWVQCFIPFYNGLSLLFWLRLSSQRLTHSTGFV